MRRYIYKKIQHLTFDLDLGVKVTQNVAQTPLHHVTYSTTKFKVATSNGLGGDTLTRNVTDGRTDGRTDRRTDGRRTDFDTKLIYPFFLKKKAGIKMQKLYTPYILRTGCEISILIANQSESHAFACLYYQL